MDRRAQHRQRGQGRDTSIPASAIAQWAKNNPLDAAALATSPIPILGDVVGGAADLKGLLDNPSFANAGLLAAGMLPFVPAGTVKRVGEGLLSGGGLKAAAIRHKGKTYTGKTHSQAIANAEDATGDYIERDLTKQGFVSSTGKFLPRDSMDAALEAIAADQFTDKILQEITMGEVKRGEPVTLIAESLRFADDTPLNEASRMARPGAIFEDFSRFSGYNTPSKPERDFADDYPEFKGQAGEKLNQSIDGDALRAKFIVGRQNAGQRDVGLDAKDARQTAESLVDYVGPGRGAELPRGAVGAYRRERVGDDVSREIIIDENLSSDGIVRVTRHELGHVIDEIAGDIPTTGIRKELDQIYHDLNDAPHRVGKTSNRTSPKNFRYKAGPDTEKELIAESLRAYMEDPNYLKTVAPKTAKRIRESINNNPRIKNIIQFNTIGGLGLTGLLGSRLMGDDEEQY
jgi:hypothetical protein